MSRMAGFLGKRFSVAAGVQSGTDLWEPSSQLARCAAPAGFRQGRAFIGPNPAMYPLSACSECAIQKESAGEREHHIYGFATIHACGCALDLRPDMAILSECATIHELSDFTLPYGV